MNRPLSLTSPVFLGALLGCGLIAPACTTDTPANDEAGPSETDTLPGTETSDPDPNPDPNPDLPAEEPETALIERVAEAMGGASALAGLQTLRVSANGESWITEEGYDPGSAFATTTFTEIATMDLAAAALRVDIDRTVGTFGAPNSQQLSEVIIGEQGWVDGVESLFGFPGGEMLSDRVASELRQQRLLHPALLIRDGLADPASVSEGARAGDLLELRFADPVHPISLWIDHNTDLPVMLTTLENDHVWRDVDLELSFDDWSLESGGLRFPVDLRLSIRNQSSRIEQRTAVEVGLELPAETFTLPGAPQLPYSAADAERGARNAHFHQVWANAGLPRDGLDLAIVPVPIPGHDRVTLLTGFSGYNSLIIEQDDAVVVVEAPLYAQRCEAILDWIDAEIGKPVSTVVITHHHYDHSACARTFVGAGATLVAGQTAESFWDEVLAAESMIEPDRLAQTGVEAELLVAQSSLALGGAPLSVEVFEIATIHASDTVMVLADGVLFTSDLYSPGFQQLLPYGPSDMLEAINLYGLAGSVDAIVGGHGAEVHSLAQLEAAATP